MTRGILGLVLLGAFALPARADVVDSGSLIIGQQGVIGGTMTVQGSAFSVGGSTFSVAEGSVTLGGILNVAATGIKWADGKISTTASSGSTVPGWALVASTNVSASTSTSLPLTADGSTYKLVVAIRQASATGNMNLRFNSDSGNNYNTEAQYFLSTGSGSQDSGAGTSRCYFSRFTDTVVAGSLFVGEYLLHTNDTDNTQTQGYYNSSWRDTSTESVRAWGSCFYDGSLQIVSLKVETPAGNFTGVIRLLKLQ